MDRHVLPNGARGFETGDFALSFGCDKAIFVFKSQANVRSVGEHEEIHYTVHVGPRSGVIDLHETRVSADGQKYHRTVFALRRDEIPSLADQFTPIVAELLRLVRPLRLGWMMHRGIGVARGVDPISDQDIAAITRKRKRRLRIDPLLYTKNVCIPTYLEEIYDFPDGSFSLFHKQRKIGLGFKTTCPDGYVQLAWVRRTDLLRFGNHWQQKVVEALRSAAISRDRHREYSFLCS